jgi:hypothetical protein
MNTSFQELTDEQFTKALEDFIFPKLRNELKNRQPGHCMRVTDLDQPLMVALAMRLRSEGANALAHILGEPESVEAADNLIISSTKLVELRNPPADGALRPPLLVFAPPNLRSSVEDSIGVATFEDIAFSNVYGDMIRSLLQELPVEYRVALREMLTALPKQPWRWADQVAQTRFLLTAIKNGKDAESIGASLYELGLVPDLHFLAEPAHAATRWRQNAEAMRKLTYSDLSLRGRVAELGIADKETQRHLTNFLLEAGVDDPGWTRRIALDRNHSKTISWDKWKFKSNLSADQIAIRDVELDLRQVTEDQAGGALQGLAGQLFLDPDKTTKLKVTFTIDQLPNQIEGLDHFTVQIVSSNGEPVGAAKTVKIGARKGAKFSASLDKLNQVEFEEGWHSVRVLPWTKEKERVALKHAGGNDEKQHESEPFYIVTNADTEDEPKQTPALHAASLEHARLELQFSSLREDEVIPSPKVSWREKSTALDVKFGRLGAYRVHIAPQLYQIERRILTSVEPCVWRLHIKSGRTDTPNKSGKPDTPKAEPVEWPRSTAFESFLAARAQYFNALDPNKRELVTQGADLLSLADAGAEYAETYRDLLRDLQNRIARAEGAEQQRAIIALRSALAIDLVRVVVTDFAGRTREAALLGPTHPLRVVWLAAWAKLGQNWVTQSRQSANESTQSTQDAILKDLSPLNVPPLLPLSHGRVLTCLDNIHHFWSLYAGADEGDPRGLLGEVCAALNLDEPAIGGAAAPPEALATRIERYLAQHPYLRALIINAFNPGRATALAKAIDELTQKRHLAGLRYDIQLFAPDPEAPGVGQAIEDLLSSREDEPENEGPASRSHLFPRLTLAVHSGADFQRSPQKYRAHLSFLFDLFPAAAIGIGSPGEMIGQSPVHGLAQDFHSDYSDDEDGQIWRKYPIHGEPLPLAGAEQLSDLLAELPKLISGCVATAAVGTPSFDQRPLLTLALNPKQRALIYDVHEVSDWVFTIDRHLGIEYFDHGKSDERPDYLIDYVPGSISSQGHKLMITSRSLDEIRAMLHPVLERHGLSATQAHAKLILDQLRAFSGRLALKLISHETQQKEALGLALARLYLKRQGALSNQIALPLDAHLDLFREAKKLADESGLESALQRTDLAIFDLNESQRTMTCRLVEVKCHDHGSGIGAYAQLKQTIAAQISQSDRMLRLHFDPSLKDPDRPDRPLKTRELNALISFYLERAARYKLIGAQAAYEARALLRKLETGYQLRFTRSALIFDFEKNGMDDMEREGGIEYYRIGKNLIETLIAWEISEPSEEEASASLPRLTTAGFVAEPRDQSQTYTLSENPVNASIEASSPQTAIFPTDDAVETPVVGAIDDVGVLDIEDQSPHASEPLPSMEIERTDADGAENEVPALNYDVMIGVDGVTRQYGLLGEIGSRKVALDLAQPQTISLFGVQGSGKSYTLGGVIEMACSQIHNINVLPKPLATVVFHYSPTADYKPEFTSMIEPNSDQEQARALREKFGAEPQGISDVVILTPAPKVVERESEFPGITVLPITFAASELKVAHWKFLMGAVGSQSMYLRQINLLMRRLRDALTLEGLLHELEQSGMSERLKQLARNRLSLAQEYINDDRRLVEVIRPGRLIIVDLRDELIEKDEALGLFLVMLQIFSEATCDGQPFNKLVVFDEAHKYIENEDLTSGLIEVVREMRHKGTSILVASQDPPSVPVALIELSSQIILHKFNSPAWLKHIQKANAALDNLTPKQMSDLGPGEAYVWSGKAGVELFTKSAVKIRCRPRVTQHGGATKMAV